MACFDTMAFLYEILIWNGILEKFLRNSVGQTSLESQIPEKFLWNSYVWIEFEISERINFSYFTRCYALDRCRSRPMSTGTSDVEVRKRLVHALSVGEQTRIWIISWISAVDMMTLRANTGLFARLICALWCWCQENRNRTLAYCFRCGENVSGCGEGLILSKCHASHSFLRLLW